MFELPNVFDPGRPNSGKHLSFGLGLHSCLGRQIANLQLKWFFVALFARFPGIRTAGEPTWNANLEFRSLQSLPLRLC
ncbi:cytochrome P450 [Streptomyces sp. NPDC001552]|uniref:cytochrome P450 n=1 Tax=Streptomyces sp. NPDC001552 TaxID=3364587 RepID=UPI0036C29D14